MAGQPTFETVIFYGHGNKNAWLGIDDLPLLDIENVKLLKGSLLVGICCLSGRMFLKLARSYGILGA